MMLRLSLILFLYLPEAALLFPNRMCTYFNHLATGWIQNPVKSYYTKGDFIIGAIIAINTNKYGNPQRPCWSYEVHTYLVLLSIVYAVEEINSNVALLPNVSLGFHVYDSCHDGILAINGAFGILSGRDASAANYDCDLQKQVVAIIDNFPSALSLEMANILRIYKYTQISATSQEQLLSDQDQFPHYYRTVTNEFHLHEAIGKLLMFFEWTWVGIITLEEGDNMKIITHLKEEIQKNGGCIEFILTIPYWFNIEERSDRVLDGIRNSTAMVIIYLGNERDLYLFSLILVHHLDSLPARIWIFTDELILKIWYAYNTFPLNGSLAFVNHKKEVPGLRDFFSVVSPERYPGDMFLKDVWYLSFRCNVPGTPYFLALPNCTGKENLKDTEDIMRFQATATLYNIYNAVYAVAHALHAAIFSPPGKKGTQGEKQLQEFNPWMFNQHLKKVHLTNTAGEEVFFDENGDSTMGFDLLNWVYTGNKSHHTVPVGRFDPLTTEGEKLALNESLITWNTVFKQTPPKSRCSEPCPVGYRKLVSESKPICCYTCIQCPEGEISNHSDAEHCLPCPEHEWPNVRRDTCIPKDVVFLSYTEPLGVALAFIASSCSVSTALVLWMFIKFRDTPVVKANNRDLSYVLLLSLTLCFLCSLLFIGHPQKVSCVLRQAVFGITFTLSVSSILGKTLTVVMAFHATKPGSKLMKWVRYRVANYLVVFCSLIQAIICIIWLSVAPPSPSYDAHSVIGQVILECNEGSFIAFYCVLGYIGFLATICFVIAFLARKLPDSFNESKFITFSMLVFCSVWISFIPAYLSTKGKYMVAVEIFAILASGAGLLGCIFIPKCYVIILRPEMNTKGQLVRT